MDFKLSSDIQVPLALSLLLVAFVSAQEINSSSPMPAPTNSLPGPSSSPLFPSPLDPVLSCLGDAIRLSICAPALNLLKSVGRPPILPCCILIEKLSNQQAYVCLCFASNSKFLGVRLSVPDDVAVLLDFCGKPVPANLGCV